jgi:hypothetical protein
LKSPLVITFIPLIIMAGLILGGRAAIVVSSLSALALIGFIPIQSKAPLSPMVEMDDPVSLSLLFLFDIFQAGALLYLASDSISKALARARTMSTRSGSQ